MESKHYRNNSELNQDDSNDDNHALSGTLWEMSDLATAQGKDLNKHLRTLTEMLPYQPRNSTVDHRLDVGLQYLRTRKLCGSSAAYYDKIHEALVNDRTRLRCRGAYGVEVIGIPLRILTESRNGNNSNYYEDHYSFARDTTQGGDDDEDNDDDDNDKNRKRAVSAANSGVIENVVHVYGTVMEELYQRWRCGNSNRDWFDFLSKYATAAEKQRMRRNAVQYLTKYEAQQYLVNFGMTGALWLNNQTIRPGLYMFVLDTTGQHLYIGEKRKGKFHHTSFVGGAPVQCAGFLKIRGGRIVGIRLHSGHYKPRSYHARLFRNFLCEKLGYSRGMSIPMWLFGKRI